MNVSEISHGKKSYTNVYLIHLKNQDTIKSGWMTDSHSDRDTGVRELQMLQRQCLILYGRRNLAELWQKYWNST